MRITKKIKDDLTDTFYKSFYKSFYNKLSRMPSLYEMANGIDHTFCYKDIPLIIDTKAKAKDLLRTRPIKNYYNDLENRVIEAYLKESRQIDKK